DGVGQNVIGRQLRAGLDLEDGLRLEQAAQGRVVVELGERSALLPSAQPDERPPDLLQRVVRNSLVDDASQALKGLQRRTAHLQHAGLAGRETLEVAQPGDPLALEIGTERAEELATAALQDPQ